MSDCQSTSTCFLHMSYFSGMRFHLSNELIVDGNDEWTQTIEYIMWITICVQQPGIHRRRTSFTMWYAGASGTTCERVTCAITCLNCTTPLAGLTVVEMLLMQTPPLQFPRRWVLFPKASVSWSSCLSKCLGEFHSNARRL